MGYIKSLMKKWFPANSFGRWALSGFYHSPIGFLFSLVNSLIATYKLTGEAFPVKVRLGIGQKLSISRQSSAKIRIDGIISVSRWGGETSESSITCSENCLFSVLGDFELGPGVHVHIGPAASLTIKGRKNSSASGITCNSRIMVEKSVEIGCDCIIAWDVFISDSDWHDIKGVERVIPVSIGDNVWISHGATIAKGVVIPSGCIVGAKSLVTRAGKFLDKSIIAGVPAVVRKKDVEWSR